MSILFRGDGLRGFAAVPHERIVSAVSHLTETQSHVTECEMLLWVSLLAAEHRWEGISKEIYISIGGHASNISYVVAQP